MVVADEELRFCESCLGVHPVTEFRRRTAGGDARLGQCRTCHNDAERQRRAAQRVKEDHARIGKFANQVKRTVSLSQAEILCDVTIKEFGGLAEFATAWAAHAKSACERQPGCKRALDTFAAVVHLLELRSASAPDLDDLTDDDLEQVLSEHLLRLNES